MDKSAIEVCLNDENKKPWCPHGPTLLFRRITNNSKNGRTFYACSACRDRKDCSFFQWSDEKVSEVRIAAREQHYRSQQPQSSHKESYQRFLKFQKLTPAERKFCQTCSLILLPKQWPQHASHQVICNLSDETITQPTKLLKSLDNKKKEAQYFCSSKSVGFLITTAKQLGFKHILCIGMPRLFELCKKQGMQALLLDIDYRYGSFISESEFCHYNMFNHHFFDSGKEIFNQFMQKKDIVIITDPPFGGLVEVLVHTFKKINSELRNGMKKKQDTAAKEIPLMWLFPYFQESRLQQHMPSLHMLDYKIEYESHSHSKIPPIKIFTNISLGEIPLPKDEGYRFCQLCHRHVAKDNQHCLKCNDCTSKNGKTYKHCDLCSNCVKSSWQHCTSCNTCHLPEHHLVKALLCYQCGKLNHKRKECPSLVSSKNKRKKK